MRRKASGLCALVLGTSLFLAGCNGEKPNIPSDAHFYGKPTHGAAVFDNGDGHILGYWDAVKNELTRIRNFQGLPEDHTTKWSEDEKGRPRNFVYNSEGNYIGYIKFADPLAEQHSQAQNLVEAEYYAKQMDKHSVSSIRIFVPDTTKIVPRKQ